MKTMIMILLLFLTACQASDNSTTPNSTSPPSVDNTVPVESQTTSSPAYDPSVSSLQNGNFIYEMSTQSCSDCHGYYGEGKSNGLVLQNVTYESLSAALVNPNNTMPNYTLSDQQKAALLEYIQSITTAQQ